MRNKLDQTPTRQRQRTKEQSSFPFPSIFPSVIELFVHKVKSTEESEWGRSALWIP